MYNPPRFKSQSFVGFKAKIDTIDFKRKLSQNRSPLDLVGILKGLESRVDGSSHQVLAAMKKMYSKDEISK